jgi:hypothetical protein
MSVGMVSRLLVPGIWRNYYKFRLSKYEIKFMNIKVVCLDGACRGKVVGVG